MKLLKNLGSIQLKPSHKSKSICGEYLCPDCKQTTINRIADVEAGKVLRCKACSVAKKRYKYTADDFNMKLIGDVIFKNPPNGKTSHLIKPYVTLECPTCNMQEEVQAFNKKNREYRECKRCRSKKNKGTLVENGKKLCTTYNTSKPINEFGVSEETKEEPYIKVVSPIYYEQIFKTKKNKTVLISANTMRNSHHYLQNNIKQWLNDYFMKELSQYSEFKIPYKYETYYLYYYKNVKSDLTNVCSQISKAFLDALQKSGNVVEDDVRHCVKEVFEVAEQDKNSPRVEIFVRQFKEE